MYLGQLLFLTDLGIVIATLERIHKDPVVTIHLSICQWTVKGGVGLVYLQKATHSYKQFSFLKLHPWSVNICRGLGSDICHLRGYEDAIHILGDQNKFIPLPSPWEWSQESR